MILVTGATGNVGRATAGELAAAGVPVRAFVRDAQKARLHPGAEAFEGDFADRASIVRALEGVDKVLLSSADGPDKVAHETAVIDAARETGAALIVKASTSLASAGSPLPPLDHNGRIEEHLRASGVDHVILASSFYMTNLLAAADQVRGMGSIFAPAAGAKIAMVDPRDVGAVAAAVLSGTASGTKRIEVTGPEPVTYERVAQAIGRATGREVAFVDIPDEALTEALRGAGMPDWLVTHLGGLFPLMRAGAFDQASTAVVELTGKPARSIDDFARDFAPAFTG